MPRWAMAMTKGKGKKSPIPLAVVLLAIIGVGSTRNHASFSPAVLALASSSSPPPPLLSKISPLSPFTPTRYQSNQYQIRASNKYGIANNSTILSPIDAALSVGVRPTLENATKGTWQRAWRLHRFMMKFILHRFDWCRPGDSKLALACLWWKALSGNDITSPVYDRELSYDLLPPVTRWIVSPRVCRWYPRLHHANVEIRTAYLDKAVIGLINSTIHETQLKGKNRRKLFRLIIMGGGYDTRGLKLLERSLLHSRTLAEDAPRRHHKLLLLDERRRVLQPQQQQQQEQQQQGWYRWHWWRQILTRRGRRINIDGQVKYAQTVSGSDSAPPSLEAELKTMADIPYDLECYELDLPEVVQAKRRLLNTRLFRRRPWLRDAQAGDMGQKQHNYPNLVEANFNNEDETRKALEGILLQSPLPTLTNGTLMDCEFGHDVTNILIFEGVMIYLDEGIPHALLQLCSEVLLKAANVSSSSTPSSEGYLCFADRLENIPGGDSDAASIEMDSTGWELIDWLPKPGLARHMGIARLRQSETTLEEKS